METKIKAVLRTRLRVKGAMAGLEDWQNKVDILESTCPLQAQYTLNILSRSLGEGHLSYSLPDNRTSQTLEICILFEGTSL